MEIDAAPDFFVRIQKQYLFSCVVTPYIYNIA